MPHNSIDSASRGPLEGYDRYKSHRTEGRQSCGFLRGIYSLFIVPLSPDANLLIIFL